MIYFDNAATSWPKPDAVPAAMERFLRECGANPGRSGHRLSIEAARVVYEARERVARLFGFDDPLSVVFTKNATEALNLALLGLLAPGDHVITSAMEHNSVMRPLRVPRGARRLVSRASPAPATARSTPATWRGRSRTQDPADRAEPRLQRGRHPLSDRGDRQAGRGARPPLLRRRRPDRRAPVPSTCAAMRIDLLAFTGHKSLYGPQGTGGLCASASAPGIGSAR